MRRPWEGRSEQQPEMFHRIAILGVGLIGASFARAARKQGLCRHIAGYGRNTENLRRALDMGIIDSFEADPAAACDAADLVLLSSPVGSFIDLAGKIAPGLKKGAVVTDAGSVKGNLVSGIEDLMPSGAHYIGAHPIAGSDRSGIDASHDELFRNALCIITPTIRSDKASLDTVIALWEKIGCRVERMDPFRHDRVFAAVSHMPHVVAFALVNVLHDLDEGFMEYAGQGFRDTTRIAASSPEIWRDISISNRDNLLEMMRAVRREFEIIIRHLETGDAAALEEAFRKAQKLRQEIG